MSKTPWSRLWALLLATTVLTAFWLEGRGAAGLMRFLSQLWALCSKELAVLARDRQAAALLFGMPAVFVLFLSLALKEVYGEKIGITLPMILEVEDDGAFARDVARKLTETGDFELVERPAGASDEELFRSGEARVTVRIPDGFSADANAFLSNHGATDFGTNRIQWNVSPSLDASTVSP